MYINKVKLSDICNGIKSFDVETQGDFVILAGGNGSGKTRLLNLISKHISDLYKEIESTIPLLIETEPSSTRCDVINYSHFDARLQQAKDFPPYVIHKAKEHLKKCDVNETALNALLYIQDLAKGYSLEFSDGNAFDDFREMLEYDFGLKLEKNDNNDPLLFGFDVTNTNLSPGQQYLLRMAADIFCNKTNNDIDNRILFLDEPETHLHSDKLIKLILKLKKRFSNTQIWIATHSIALISCLYANKEYSTTILEFQSGNVRLFGSNSEKLVYGLLGSEKNRRSLHEFIASPDAFAAIDFAIKCLDFPNVSDAKRGDVDPQVSMVYKPIKAKDVIVDYGAGKGRLLLELSKFDRIEISKIFYYAYDEFNKYEDDCKRVMKDKKVDVLHYYSGKDSFNVLSRKIQDDHNGANFVLLINTLHEISPEKWIDLFSNIKSLLKEDGYLLIIEQEELTYGERPYDSGFMVLTENGFSKLFPNLSKDHIEKEEFGNKRFNILYAVPKTALPIDYDSLINCMKVINKDSLDKIKKLKEGNTVEQEDASNAFSKGIKLSFWTHQFANSALNLKKIKHLNKKLSNKERSFV